MPDAFQELFNAELKMPSGVEKDNVSWSLPNTAEILSVGSLEFT